MRVPALVCTPLLVACAPKHPLPDGPVLTPEERVAFDAVQRSGVDYTGPRQTSLPVPPALVWALSSALTLRVVTEDPQWAATELSLVDTPQGAVWLAADTARDSGEQSLVGDVAPDAWPELGLPLHARPVRVEDRSSEAHLDLDLFYTNGGEQSVHLSYQGPRPAPVKARNGGPLGAEAHQLVTVYDRSGGSRARHATLRVAGQDQPLARRGAALAVNQAKAGLSTGSLQLAPLPPPFADAPVNEARGTLARPGQEPSEQRWQVAQHPDGFELVQRTALRTLRYRFVGDEHPEWVSATVTPWNTDEPALHLLLQPALPDLGAPFAGEATSRLVLDVGEGQAHAVGTATASWGEAGPTVRFELTAPEWAEGRVMRSALRFEDGVVELLSEVD